MSRASVVGTVGVQSVTAMVDELCDAFESAWQIGRRPRMESSLAKVDPADRGELLRELLLLELDYRRQAAEQPTLDEYRRRFPEHDLLIEELLHPTTPAGTEAVVNCEDQPVCDSDRFGQSEESARQTLRNGVCPQPTVASARIATLSKGQGNRSPSGPPSRSEAAGQRVGHSASNAVLLSMTWPFSKLPRKIICAILDHMEEREFARGTELLRQGELSRCLIVLVDGTTQVSVRDRRLDHDIAQTGCATIIGEMGLVTDEMCTATVTAITPVRALVLPTEWFHRLVLQYPVLRTALSCLIARRLGQREVDTLTGKILHGYRIRRCVGRGGMGMVYEAEDLATGRQVALKMMSHRLTHSRDAQKRFEREMQFCQDLAHPNISRVYECFEAFGTNFIVMEYYAGPTLEEIIRHYGSLQEGQIRVILGQLARALSHAHRHGVCHRDLKPANVMFTREGTLKLMDFGLARATGNSESSTEKSVTGTPNYMPPEQFIGKPADRRGDIFSLGCIVYEMLTGKPPFPGKDCLQILRQQAEWSLPPACDIRPGLSEDLYAVLRQSLTDNPHDRVLDIEQLASWSETMPEFGLSAGIPRRLKPLPHNTLQGFVPN